MKRKLYRVQFTFFAGAGLVLGQRRSASADHAESQEARPSVVPGEYVLQIMITDKLAKQKYRSAMQWMDFEITK